MQLSGHVAYLLYAASFALAIPLEKRSGTSYSGGTTADDVENGVCGDVTFIFARGSTESGTMGSTVGPALAKKLISDLGADKLAIQGVDYTASIASNIEMGSGGGPVMKQLADKALSACPNTKIVLSGYSQGCEVVHYAVKTSGLSPDDVAAVVLYGDPEDGTSVGSLPTSKLKEFCASGDGVCEQHGFDISAAHLSYTNDGDIASGAQFVESLVGGSSSSGSQSSSVTTATASETTSSASSIFGSFGSLFGGDSNATTSASGASSSASSDLSGLLGGLESSATAVSIPTASSAAAGGFLGSFGGLEGSGTAFSLPTGSASGSTGLLSESGSLEGESSDTSSSGSALSSFAL